MKPTTGEFTKRRTLLACLLVAAACPAPGAPAAQRYEVVLFEKDRQISARDGVRLATDIYRPAREGSPISDRLPILLHRTPYDKTGAALVRQAKEFVGHGYVVALQDVRGRYGSEGLFSKYKGDAHDGYDTIEWLAKLPYGNGAVGMWGTSYAAHVQANAAKMNPPHLKALVLNMGGMYNGWDHKIRNHGAFELQQLTWAFAQLAAETRDPVIQAHLAGQKLVDWFAALPFRRGLNPLSIAPNFEEYLLEMATRGDYDEYWRDIDTNWEEYYDQTADIPMLHVSGWYDSYCGGTIRNYIALSKTKRSPIHLLMGPWVHGRNSQTHAGDVEFGPDAAISDFRLEFHLRWFDHFLGGKSTGVERDPPVQIFVMGTGDGHKDENGRLYHGGYWRKEKEWPPAGAEFVSYYLHPGGGLRAQPPVLGHAATTYTYDPLRPVPTIGGAFSGTAPVFEPGAFHQREREYTGDPSRGFYGSRPPYLPLKTRSDVVVFQSEPLAVPVQVIGPVRVRLFVSSTALDTDFTVKLVDVYPPSLDFPDGFEMNLTDGILRARYRNSRSRQEWMKSDEIYELEIEPFPTANVFKKGHRIRIDISSSNFPRFDVNPNTGEPLGLDRRVVVADNTIHHDRSRPSRLILGIVP